MKILKKSEDRDFVILNLSDPQLSDSEWKCGRKESRLLRYTVSNLVEQTKPDLITVSGDLAWAGNYISYTKLTKLLDSHKIPWAPVFGNHDIQGGTEALSKAADILCGGKYSLFERGDPALGCGNYVIGIEQDGRLIHGVIMMDSHDRREYVNEKGEKKLEWADLIPEQFPWYREQISRLKEQGAAKSTIILHIPLYTYREAAKAAFKPGFDFKSVSPYNGGQTGCWNEGYEDSFGVMYESISSYPANNGFFDEIIHADHTKTVLCGHDHVNTFSVNYRGVRLMFALKTGSGCYWDQRINGGTVLKINKNGDLSAKHIFITPCR